MNLRASMHAYKSYDYLRWTSIKNTVLIVHLQTSCGSRNKAVSFRGSPSCMTKTKFSDILFQNSKLLLLVSLGIVYSERPQWVGIS